MPPNKRSPENPNIQRFILPIVILQPLRLVPGHADRPAFTSPFVVDAISGADAPSHRTTSRTPTRSWSPKGPNASSASPHRSVRVLAALHRSLVTSARLPAAGDLAFLYPRRRSTRAPRTRFDKTTALRAAFRSVRRDPLQPASRALPPDGPSARRQFANYGSRSLSRRALPLLSVQRLPGAPRWLARAAAAWTDRVTRATFQYRRYRCTAFVREPPSRRAAIGVARVASRSATPQAPQCGSFAVWA